MNLISIQLTADEALMFTRFQKHHAFIGLLEEIKAFDIKSGSIKIHFDGQGKIGKVEKQEFYTP